MNNKFDKIIKSKPKERAKAIKKLEGFLLDTGRFSILVLGLRGTGKTHWLQTIQKANEKEKYLSGIVIVNAALANNSDKKFWNNKFIEANNKLLVVEDVEQLSNESQEVLLGGLSPGKGNRYGFDEKKYEFRVAFTSAFDIKTLRDTQQCLSNKFFDRISQLVVKLPSYTDARNSIWRDFRNSWKKMNFKQKNEMPGYELRNWLEEHSHELHGHFYDLNKIAINWHHCRITGIKENEILSSVINDFRELFHFPEHNSELPKAFYIDAGLDWEGNLRNFRRQYKEWVKIEYGSLRKGEKKVGVSYRTIERW